MLSRFLFSALLFSAAAHSQLIINTTTLSDSILYNAINYVQAATQQQVTNGIHTVVYTNTLNPAYQMKKIYMDSARTKLLSITFYHQGKLDGPHESYQMDKPLTKGRYKNNKPDGERITYWGNGTTIMEKAEFKNGKRFGIWEYYNMQGVLKRKVTYGNNGTVAQDQQF